MCNENAATCEEDGQQEEMQKSVDNDDEDSENSERHQDSCKEGMGTSAEGC